MAIKLFRKIYGWTSKIICSLAPYSIGPQLAKIEYKRITGANMDLHNPKNLIEKIVWMQFHTDTKLWTQCADKYEVRNFIESKGLGDILPKLYGKWDKASEIDFDELPDKFVLKTNNSCGQIIIVRDKNKLNLDEARNKLDQWLKMRYGYHNAQLHYLRIKPCIIAEELLEDSSLELGENLIDYKIWCFHGAPESIMTVNGRNGASYLVSMYDLNWNNVSDKTLNHSSSHFGNTSITKPKNFEEMIAYAKILSKGFPEVRVDFYDIDGKIYFGEMTFTTGYGYRSKEYSEYLGSKIDLSKIKRIR